MAFSVGHVLATATPATERIHMHTYRGAYCMPVPVDRPTYSHSTGQRPTAWSQCPQWSSPQPTTINTQSAVPATQTPVHRPLNKQVMSLCRVLYLFYSYTTTLLSDITFSSYINTTLWFTKKLAHCKSAIGDIMSAASTDSSNNKISNLTVMTTHTHPFNGPLSGTTWVSRYQRGKTNLDFTEARDSEWQGQQLGHMQVCTSLQTDNHASTPPLRFLQAGCPSCRQPTASKH